jgi:hypothetical protein
LGTELGKERLEKTGGVIKNLEIIRDCFAIYRHIKKELR